jgi:hypothetical protein
MSAGESGNYQPAFFRLRYLSQRYDTPLGLCNDEAIKFVQLGFLATGGTAFANTGVFHITAETFDDLQPTDLESLLSLAVLEIRHDVLSN